jgi:DNA-binding CsgD family transcriptional regulator
MDNQGLITFEGVGIEDLVCGYAIDTEGRHSCLYCGATFEKGHVYSLSGGLVLAEVAARHHVADKHGGAFEALLSRGGESAGLTEIQERLLRLLHEGKDDRAIAAELGGKSESTVRNHRFNLRKRAGEAKAFLAIMALVERSGRTSAKDRFVDYPAAMPVKDERTVVTETEAAAIEARCLSTMPDGSLKILFWPRKQKEKLVVLRRVAGLFEQGRKYGEAEVNAVLMPVHDDHVTIRRYLIEYRFLDRKPDGSAYWRT